jgi:hypothetical protein
VFKGTVTCRNTDQRRVDVPALSIVAQVDELEGRVAAHTAEREQSDSEMQRLSGELEARNAELVIRDSELAQAREIVAAKEAQLARSSEETRAAFDRTTHVGVLKQGDRPKELRAAKDETAALQGKLNATEAALAETKAALIRGECITCGREGQARRTGDRGAPAAGGVWLGDRGAQAERDVAKADLLRVQSELERLKAESVD